MGTGREKRRSSREESSREEMKMAAAQGAGWEVKSTRQAPGQRGARRPESFNSERRDMNQKLEQAQAWRLGRNSTAFIAACLMAIGLIWYNGVLMRGT